MIVEVKDRSEFGRLHDRRLVWAPIKGGKLLLLKIVEGDDTKSWVEVNRDDVAALGRAFSEPVRDT